MAQTKKARQGTVGGSTTRLTGEPIMRILCKKTDTLVGYLYQWNNGDLQPAWLNNTVAKVRYEPMVKGASPASVGAAQTIQGDASRGRLLKQRA